jgi:hypothetical protein
MALDTSRVKTRIGDELGLTDEDLARLYNVDAGQLNRHLASMGKDENAVSQQILSDVDAARTNYRLLQVNDEHIAAAHEVLREYIFHPLVATPMADGNIGWRLSLDDAQFVAFRIADIVGVDYDWSDVLRYRLHRLIIWPDEKRPAINQAFYDRVAEMTFFLIELTGVL